LVSRDAYFGVPPANFLGWILTGTLVTRAMLAVIPPSIWAAKVAPHQFPLALYAANAILPITICLRWGMAPAAFVGIVAMGRLICAALYTGPHWVAWSETGMMIHRSPRVLMAWKV
jgi:uncharacterized membrane protein